MAQNKLGAAPPATQKGDLLDWWICTVLLTFLPLLFVMLMEFLTSLSVDFNRLVGDGELILSAFLIITPAIIKLHNEGAVKTKGKKIFYLSLLTAFFQLVAYTAIKMNDNNIPIVVYITSGLCVVASIIIARRVEKT